MIADPADRAWLGDTAMGELIGACDWSGTTLGPLAAWPLNLRVSLGICLNALAPLGVCWGPDLRVLYNDAWKAMLGSRHPGALGVSARELFGEIWNAIGPHLEATACRGEATAVRNQRMQLVRNGASQVCSFDFTFNPIPDGPQGTGGVFIIALETTERVRAEAEMRLSTLREEALTANLHTLQHDQTEQRVVVAELQHRTRNLLAVVRAIASQTFERSQDRTVLKAFIERLGSLGRVQGLLSRVEGQRVKLIDVVHAELDPHGCELRSRLEIHGPDVRLSCHQVQPFALALHELVTNSLKYGALQAPCGRLSVTWETWSAGHGRPRLALTWKESGVAMPAGAGHRRGQGRELIEHALPFSLRAQTQLVFGTDGVWCRIELPLDAANSSTLNPARLQSTASRDR